MANEGNQVLYEKAEEVIQALFDDMSVTKEEALENMQGIRDFVREKIDVLKSDIENEESEDEDE